MTDISLVRWNTQTPRANFADLTPLMSMTLRSRIDPLHLSQNIIIHQCLTWNSLTNGMAVDIVPWPTPPSVWAASWVRTSERWTTGFESLAESTHWPLASHETREKKWGKITEQPHSTAHELQVHVMVLIEDCRYQCSGDYCGISFSKKWWEHSPTECMLCKGG